MPKKKPRIIKIKKLQTRYTSYIKDALTKRLYKNAIKKYTNVAYIYEDKWRAYLGSTENAIIDKLKQLKLKGNEAIIDAGCGTGSMIFAIQTKLRHKGKIFGFDITPAMLDLAEAKLAYKSRFIKSLQLELAHCENFSAKNKSVDIVICSSVLHYLPHPDKALYEFHRVLKKRGRLILLDICTDYPTTKLFDIFARIFHKAHHKAYSTGEVEKLLKKNKFRIVSFRTWKATPLFGVMLFEAKSI